MKLRTIIIMTTFLAMTIVCRSAAAGEAESYPVIAYAVPAERSLIAMHATPDRIDYRTEASLFSSPTFTGTTEAGLIVEWRERVFRSLSANVAPDAADAERMVTRTVMKESMKMALEHLPSLERVIRALKLEVSTDMLAGEQEADEDGNIPAFGATPERRPAAKERFFMKTGLRIPIEQGKPALLSETHAVYGSVTTFFNVRLDSKLDSSLGLRYMVDRTMHIQVERTTADAVDLSSGGMVRRSVSNMVKVVCVF